MKITWLGHSGFRIEIGDQILLVDPWLEGNPMLPKDKYDEVVEGATHILISHGHSDHAVSGPRISKDKGVPVAGIFDLMRFFEETFGITTIGFNKGGTIQLGNVSVTMVNAVHSSSFASASPKPAHAGDPAGFMISGEGHTIYFTGDTDVMADMKIFNDLHRPDIGILCAGGHYTMDMKRAAYAAREFFDFKMVIPCHYKTMPLLAQSADELVALLPDIDVRTPDVLGSIEI